MFLIISFALTLFLNVLCRTPKYNFSESYPRFTISHSEALLKILSCEVILKLRLLSCEVIWNRGCFHLKLFETSEAVIMWSYFVIMWSGFETGNVSLTIFKGAAVSKVCYKISVMKLWTRNDDCVLNPEFLIELPDISVMLNLCYITQTLL